jgi:apolipoprotein N-acyltransferase
MAQKVWLPYLFIVTSALVTVFSFPPYKLGLLMLVGLVPLFLALDSSDSWKTAALRAGIFAFLTNFLTTYWVPASAREFGGLPVVAAWLSHILLSVFEQSSWVVVAVLRHVLRNRYKSSPLLWTPAAIMVVDAAWPKYFPTTFGATFYTVPWIAQAADLTGVWGLTALIAASNESIATFISKRLQLSPKLVRRNALIGLGLSIVIMAYGVIRWQMVREQMRHPTRTVRVAVVQPALNAMAQVRAVRDPKEKAHERARILAHTLRLNEKAVLQAPAFIVWPETAYPDTYHNSFNPREAAYVSARLDEYMLSAKTQHIFGARDMAHDGRWYNAIHSVRWSGKGLIDEVYHKNILLPIAEEVPLAGFSEGYDQFMRARGAAFFARGEGPRLLSTDHDLKLGPMICLEGLYPRYVREIASRGAQVLVNATNDAWFGPTNEPAQHFYLTTFRAIETRRPMVRAATSGYSATIDIDGSVRKITNLFEESVLVDDLPIYQHIVTPFMVVKDAVFALAALYVAITFVIAARRLRRT